MIIGSNTADFPRHAQIYKDIKTSRPTLYLGPGKTPPPLVKRNKIRHLGKTNIHTYFKAHLVRQIMLLHEMAYQLDRK